MSILKTNELFENKTESFLSLPIVPISEVALSDSPEVMKMFSNLDFPVQISDNKWGTFSNLVMQGETQIYTALLIKTMCQDLNGVKELLQILEKNPKAKKKNEWFKEELPFFEGIVQKDKDKVFETINHLCSPKQHKLRNSHFTYGGLLSFPAIGYAKMAWLNNIELEFENNLIINELLPITPNAEYKNKIKLLIPKMTLESEYKFHGGSKVKERNGIYFVFVLAHSSLHGKDCVSELLIPNIHDFEPNFIGIRTGKIYTEGILIGTHIKTNNYTLLKQAMKIKRIGFFKKRKTLNILQKYLDEIDEISKTQQGVIMYLDKEFNLKYKPQNKSSKPKKNKALSKVKRKYLNEFGKLCLSKLGYEIYQDEIKNLNNYDLDEEYGSTLNYLSERLNEDGILFLINLDWKTEISQFKNLINSSLKENFSETFMVNLAEKYTVNSSISNDGVFQNYNTALENKGYELGLLDTDGDSYIFFINRLVESKNIDHLTKKIGFKKLMYKNGL